MTLTPIWTIVSDIWAKRHFVGKVIDAHTDTHGGPIAIYLAAEVVSKTVFYSSITSMSNCLQPYTQ